MAAVSLPVVAEVAATRVKKLMILENNIGLVAIGVSVVVSEQITMGECSELLGMMLR